MNVNNIKCLRNVDLNELNATTIFYNILQENFIIIDFSCVWSHYGRSVFYGYDGYERVNIDFNGYGTTNTIVERDIFIIFEYALLSKKDKALLKTERERLFHLLMSSKESYFKEWKKNGISTETSKTKYF